MKYLNYDSIKTLGIPIWSLIATTSLWYLIGIHIIFPTDWGFIHTVINFIFTIALITQTLWIGCIIYNKNTGNKL